MTNYDKLIKDIEQTEKQLEFMKLLARNYSYFSGGVYTGSNRQEKYEQNQIKYMKNDKDLKIIFERYIEK